MSDPRALGWIGIVRLGLVQTALGAIVVLTTSTLNRIMVVEIAMPAIVPGFLVALHYALQIFRPRLGHGSDVGGRRTPWIIGGMAMLGSGGVVASLATVLMLTSPILGVALGVVAFTMIGLGVGACGTTLLVLLAKRAAERRRAAAATVVWVMMICGFIITSAVVGHVLDPFSPTRLIIVASCVAVAALLITIVAVWGIEGDVAVADPDAATTSQQKSAFREALAEVWNEPQSRQFAIFIFLSMIAYSAQDLILEPFAGVVFGYTPGESTKLSGIQNSGVLAGMILVAILGSGVGGRWFGSMRNWTIAGCVASACALYGIAAAGLVGPSWPLRISVFALGFANGAYAVSAIGSMMGMVSEGAKAREGIRMGLWGAAQAVAFGLGGLIGTSASDLSRMFMSTPAQSYSLVFALEGTLFIFSAFMAARIGMSRASEAEATRV